MTFLLNAPFYPHEKFYTLHNIAFFKDFFHDFSLKFYTPL
ncbi:hypothetical protein AF6_0496 [Anoxybacillus flavithermus TNO-09.006]|nr:hypothetical protein AF6_0496 [Anoxybacillus flavithermus TNO-09.006]